MKSGARPTAAAKASTWARQLGARSPPAAGDRAARATSRRARPGSAGQWRARAALSGAPSVRLKCRPSSTRSTTRGEQARRRGASAAASSRTSRAQPAARARARIAVSATPATRPTSSAQSASVRARRRRHDGVSAPPAGAAVAAHEVDRPLLDLVEDAADVFAEDADREQLHAAEEHRADGQRRPAGDVVAGREVLDDDPGAAEQAPTARSPRRAPLHRRSGELRERGDAGEREARQARASRTSWRRRSRSFGHVGDRDRCESRPTRTGPS